MNYQKITQEVRIIAKEVALFIKSQQQLIKSNDIESKGNHDFVTYVDKTAEQKIIEGLEKIIPNSGFIAEEGTSTKVGTTYNWIIDPLDGTTNFIHGISPFAISIALQENDKTVLGVIHEISLDECFYAWEDGKAYMNDKEIAVSKQNNLSKSLIATGFPYYDYSKTNDFLTTLEYFMRETSGVRRLGSAATDLAYVAAGRFESFFEYSLRPWDVAAGAFIVEKAGGIVCDFSGGNNYIFGKEIIASCKPLSNQIFNVVNKNLANKN